MRETLGIVTLLVFALLVAPCPSGAQQADATASPVGRWESRLGLQNPLVGRIWDVRRERFVTPAKLAAALVSDRFVLLGEKHDNPDDHRLQAWIIGRLVAAGRRPAVAFEMLSVDVQPALDAYLRQHPGDAAGIGEAVGWSTTGWPPWPIYEPVFAAALGAGLPIVAANLDQADTRLLSKAGIAGLQPERAHRLLLDRPLPPSAQASLAKEIVDAHCGYADEDMISMMVAVQRGRDACMADRMAGASEGGAVLITGFGHARLDRGVPLYLRERVPGATLRSVAFLEVQKDWKDPDAYREEFDGAPLPYDFVWFTPRLDDQDPCEKFRKSLEKLKAGGEMGSGGPTPAPTPGG